MDKQAGLQPVFETHDWNGMLVREYPATRESAAFLTIDFPSSSDPDRCYVVLIEGSTVECTCPDYTYRGHTPAGVRIPGYQCKHIKAVVAKITGK